MFPLIWLFATIVIAVFAAAGMFLFWRLFCEDRGGEWVGLFTSASFFALLGSVVCFIAIAAYSIYSLLGPEGTGIVLFLLVFYIALRKSKLHLGIA